MINSNFIITIFVTNLVCVIITGSLGFIFKGKKFVKYIPTIISVILFVLIIVKAQNPSKSFETVGYVLFGIIVITTFSVSLITALTVDGILYFMQMKKDKTKI